MKICETMNDFVQMHMDLELPMPKGTFQDTIPMPHRITNGLPTVHQMFAPYYDVEMYVLAHAEAVKVHNIYKQAVAVESNINYKAPFGAGGTFKDQLCRFSLTDEGLQLGLQATRNFRLAGAIHFQTPEQAKDFLDRWIAIREQEEE